MDSKRVRIARALDAIDELVVKQCADSVRETIDTSEHAQVTQQFVIVGAVEDAARKQDVGFASLWPATCEMMRDALSEAMGGVRNGREYIRAYSEDGRVVGFEVNYYMFNR